MSILGRILRYLKLILFGLIGLFFIYVLWSVSFEYGKYLLDSQVILAACAQCDGFSINLGFFTVVAACLIGAYAGFFPPKGIFFSFLLSFWLLCIFAFSYEIWNFSLHPFNYRYPDEIIIYADKIRLDWIAFAWGAVGVLQVYLKPPLRKYVIILHSTLTLLNAFFNGTILN